MARSRDLSRCNVAHDAMPLQAEKPLVVRVTASGYRLTAGGTSPGCATARSSRRGFRVNPAGFIFEGCLSRQPRAILRSMNRRNHMQSTPAKRSLAPNAISPVETQTQLMRH